MYPGLQESYLDGKIKYHREKHYNQPKLDATKVELGERLDKEYL